MVARRNTRQRELVMDAVRSLANHPTANEVYEYVHARDEHVSMGTVYRNLNLLAESGDILSVQAPAGCHYDFRNAKHAHVVCTQCGRMDDAMFEYDADADRRAEADSGYKVAGHCLVFEGICPVCQKLRGE